MNKTITEPENLDAFLEKNFPESSKNTLKKWLKEGRFLINGEAAKKMTHPLVKGDLFCFSKKQQRGLSPNIQIVFENEDFLVIDKPDGLLSVAKDRNTEANLHDLVKAYLKPAQVYVIHRLDKKTSGLIVFAKTFEFYQELKEQLKEKKVKRLYQAVIKGTDLPTSGTWESFLFEDKNLYMRVSDSSLNAERACTHFHVLQKGKTHSLVEFSLETGKKNQIRVQAAHAGFPILGDKKYGVLEKHVKRMYLHAFSLSFYYPKLNKNMTFSSPTPKSFEIKSKG